MSDQISFACTGCAKIIDAPLHLAGKKAQCPSCKTPLVIPAPKKRVRDRPRQIIEEPPVKRKTKRARRETPTTPRKSTRTRDADETRDEQPRSRGKGNTGRGRRDSKVSKGRPQRKSAKPESNPPNSKLGPGNETLAMVLPIVNCISFIGYCTLIALGEAGLALFFFLILGASMVTSGWKLFTRNGEQGWAILIPFYGWIIFAKMGGKPWWWLLLMMIPFIGPVFGIIIMHEICKKMGRGIPFLIGFVLLPIVFQPLLAFGEGNLEADGDDYDDDYDE